MIYVSKTQLGQVEYLIHQSIQGNHVLFDVEDVRRVFWKNTSLLDTEFSVDLAYSVEPHLERIILLPTLSEKRAYLSELDRETFEQVVKTYFNIIENNIYEKLEAQH